MSNYNKDEFKAAFHSANRLFKSLGLPVSSFRTCKFEYKGKEQDLIRQVKYLESAEKVIL